MNPDELEQKAQPEPTLLNLLDKMGQFIGLIVDDYKRLLKVEKEHEKAKDQIKKMVKNFEEVLDLGGDNATTGD